jgi:hypothetical protein
MRETIAVFGATLLGASALTWGGVAHAQQTQQNAPFFSPGGDDAASYGATHPDVGMEGPPRGQYLAAPKQAFELKLAGVYTQGFGNAVPGVGMPSVAGAGVGGNLDLDYRMTPHASVGVQGQYAEFTSENNAASRGVMGNIGVTYHGAPFTRADPWLRFGAGYRLLWSVHPVGPAGIEGPTVLLHGFELGNLLLGYDFRLSEGVALSPMAGIDLNLFIWDRIDGVSTALSKAQVNTFVFAGIQGRFDAGPTTSGYGMAKSSSPTGINFN